jgi:hypothetical protein
MAARAAAAQPTREIAIISPTAHPGSLRIFDKIERGLGVVPILDDMGAPLLCSGDVAVYDADWHLRNDLQPGTYCVEWQRPANLLPREEFGRRFAAGEPVRMRIDREIVAIARWKRDPTRWAIHPLVNTYRGIMQMSDGPLESWYLHDKLLGPIVGLYRPAPIEGAN